MSDVSGISTVATEFRKILKY